MFVPFSFFWLVFPFIKEVMLLYRKKKIEKQNKTNYFYDIMYMFNSFSLL